MVRIELNYVEDTFHKEEKEMEWSFLAVILCILTLGYFIYLTLAD
ncbi:hypothetical protein [Peribacillus asahii]|nr:hypothetical protein [Peribacillus asahii]